MEGSTLKKRENFWRSVHRRYYDTRISGRTSSLKRRMKRYDNIVKSTLLMQGKTRHSVHLHLDVYELEKDQKTRKQRKDPCLVTKSRKQRRPNAQLVQQECRAFGGEHREVYLEMPCARIAGKFPACVVVDDSADYRKYGVISFTKSEDSKKPEKSENKAKKQKVSQCKGC